MGSLELVGTSAAITALRPEIDRAALFESKVLITGESGVGKENVARRLHAASRRCRTPFVAINCAGMPETLLESELFGHAKGSFTGAYRDKPGLLQLAHRGTLFLDEVGETTHRMQSLLLRFLETGEIQHVGSSTAREPDLDVRVIAATNRDLPAAVAAGEFRQDFFYRLNVVHLHVPPLRERAEDIPLLLDHFTREACLASGATALSYSSGALALLQAYAWPGNVRELKNVVERLVARHRGGTVEPAHLPAEIKRSAGSTPSAGTQSARSDVVNSIFERISRQRESFWSAAYAPFMLRDLTRDDIRALIARGLEEAGGDYGQLTKVFNMDSGDYRRLVTFLRKHHCQSPLHQFRMTESRPRHDQPGSNA